MIFKIEICSEGYELVPFCEGRQPVIYYKVTTTYVSNSIITTDRKWIKPSVGFAPTILGSKWYRVIFTETDGLYKFANPNDPRDLFTIAPELFQALDAYAIDKWLSD